MEVFTKNTVIKKILIVLIVIIMINNFIMPNYVHASAGSKLVSGLFYLIAYIGDVFIELMQGMMVGTSEIKVGENYEILYSPGVIFSNDVLLLDINFISPNQKTTNKTQGTDTSENLFYKQYIIWFDMSKPERESQEDVEMLLEQYGYNEEEGYKVEQQGMNSWVIIYKWRSNQGNQYTLMYAYSQTYFMVSLITDKVAVTGQITSTAKELRSNIAKWYVALRNLALVGLLSVLLYIGIRIILSSSSAQDKAKYKNMLKDWLVAICIIFVLHYIMAFMLQMTSSLNYIIKKNVVTSSERGAKDELMSSIRNSIGSSYEQASAKGTAGYTIMYLTLVILTGIFTVQYLKRVVYMAFLTMIAPMIALTYPLDKIKDGKAQAFSFWIKEYIFNCLIQPVHLLLYTLLITNAKDFATNNILYAIVALAFLVPAEKLIKDMFGMKSQSPVGTLGAAAGGALVMNMLNKMKDKGPKESGGGAGGSSSPKGTRTATRGGDTGATSQQGAGGTQPLSTLPIDSSDGATGGQVGGSGANHKSIRKMLVKGADRIKPYGKKFTRAIGGVAGATIGTAAGLATGDFSNAAKYAATGAVAGGSIAGNIGGSLDKGIDKIQEYIMGNEKFSNSKFDKEFYKSDGYKQIAQDQTLLKEYGGKAGIEQATQEFLENGITDASQIRKAMKKGISGDEFKSYSKLGITNVDEIAAAKRKWGSASYYANLKKIAKFAKNKSPDEFKAMISNIRINGTDTPTTDEVNKIYDNIVDLL